MSFSLPKGTYKNKVSLRFHIRHQMIGCLRYHMIGCFNRLPHFCLLSEYKSFTFAFLELFSDARCISSHSDSYLQGKDKYLTSAVYCDYTMLTMPRASFVILGSV